MVTDLEATSRSSRALYIGQPIATWRYAFNGKGWLIISLCVGLLFVPLGDRDATSSKSGLASSAPASPAPTVPIQATAIPPAPTPLPPLEPVVGGNTPPETKVSRTLLVERVPPIGKGLVLDPAQIRYCLSEGIRIAAWHERANRYSQRAVDTFNAVVNDYNARCGNFSYRSGTLESVRAEVEKNRDMLVQLGFESAERNR
ncbi:hypothetical protein [Methyloversatilis sp. RAC08]|uniref:hypothetical protein n=1 Tax=Methyloversatilis sp. RAC08 TaxID=1842540 RepID=UPI0012370F2F|nr:hypothetical protein [Methyloversatilis sp. RAC08]